MQAYGRRSSRSYCDRLKADIARRGREWAAGGSANLKACRRCGREFDAANTRAQVCAPCHGRR